MKINTVSVIGGDLRQKTLGRLLKKEGFEVLMYGFEHSEDANIDDALKSDALIFPMPMCSGENILGTDVSLKKVLDSVTPENAVLGGKLNQELKDILRQRKIFFCDYAEREPLALKNAVATVEGAVKIAIEESPVMLYKSQSIVVGYGRIGRLTARILRDFGSRVYVAARRKESRIQAEIDGFDAIEIKDIAKLYSDFIINTVPAQIIDRRILSHINKDVLIIDLASKPGGVEFEACREMGIKVIWALGIPGKISPVSAGRIIFEEAMDIFEELEVL